ncbi:MAG: hypothetical protein ACC645_09050, partial [Pirellulales bacterium]
EAGDTDRFTIDLDDSQIITVVAEGGTSLQTTLTLSDPDAAEIGQAVAVAAGERTVIQTVPTTGPGTYTVTVGGVAGSTGPYSVRLILGAAVEEERPGEAANNDLATAEDLDDRFMDLGLDSAARAAVLGTFNPPEVIGLGADVNTAEADRNPSISADGLNLLFDSTRPGGFGGTDLYIATRASTSEPFGVVTNLGPEVNTDSSEVAPALSTDRLTLYFGSNRSGAFGKTDLYMATRSDTASPFGTVTNLGLGVNSPEADNHPVISSDGLTLLFNSKRSGGQGGQDIYVATRADTSQSFGDVVNLGPRVNSDANEVAPALSADGLTLYYHSNRPGGFGGDDLYVATRVTTSDTFRNARNLGPGINSEKNEQAPAVFPDRGRLLFASDRPAGQGGLDVYMAQRDADWYRFTLTDHQSAALALAAADPGDARLELYDSNANLLAIGAAAANAEQILNNFVDTTDDGSPTSYFVRVVGGASEYNLLVTKGANFDREPNDKLGQADQDITVDGTVLGALFQALDRSDDSSSDTLNLWTTLTDGEGFRWDIKVLGNIGQGTDNGYDNGLKHNEFPAFTRARSEQNGREIVVGPATIGDVQVTRKIYVPNDRGFARYLEIVTNTSVSPVQYRLELQSDLGSDDATQLIGSSIDDGVWNAQDDWVVTDNDREGDRNPTLLHVLSDGNAMRPTFAELSGDAMFVKYDLALAPGETQIVMHFASKNADRATALAKAPRLVALESGALVGISLDEARHIVNFVPRDTDVYSFEASEGDLLSIGLSLPDAGTSQVVNELKPVIELFDPNGERVATGATDPLTYAVTLSGTYAVQVLAEDGTWGEYVLSVRGQTGGLPPFEVTATDPPGDALLLPFQRSIRVDLSDAVRLTSVAASDLTVNGAPATAVDIVDADTLVFTLPPLADGVNHLSIASGAIVDLQGQPIEAFSRELLADLIPPRVIESSLQEGDTVATNAPLAVTLRFSEPLLPSALDPADVQLTGQRSGDYVATAFRYEPAISTLTLQFEALPDDQYTLTLTSGDGAFEDLVGNDLDGEPLAFPIPPEQSGDGEPGGDFVVHFRTDFVTAEFPVPLDALSPEGSLIYDGSVGGSVDTVDDTDGVTIKLDDGQTITVVVETQPALQATVALFDPNGAEIGTATAGSAGDDVLLQTTATTMAGMYTVVVGDVGGTTGGYSVRLVLGAAIEAEGHGGSSNDDLASADDLTGSFIALGTTSAARGAVLAAIDDEDPADWYRFSLEDGQSATLALVVTDVAAPSLSSPITIAGFQQGEDGYTGTADTMLAEDAPTANHRSAPSLNVDGDDPSGSGRAVQTLIRFDGIFGTDPAQIGASDQIVSALLELNVTNPGDRLALHHMLSDWSNTANWNTFGGNGIQADGAEAASDSEVVTLGPRVGQLSIDVTESLRAWQA